MTINSKISNHPTSGEHWAAKAPRWVASLVLAGKTTSYMMTARNFDML